MSSLAERASRIAALGKFCDVGNGRTLFRESVLNFPTKARH